MSLLRQGNSVFVSNTFLIFLSRFFPSLSSLGVILWFSRRLPREVYGFYTNFWIQLNLLVPVACFGIHVVITTYSPSKIAALRAAAGRYWQLILLAWILLWAGVFSIIQTGYSGWQLSIPLLYFSAFSIVTILESVYVVHKKFPALISVNFLYAAVFLGIHIQYDSAVSIPYPLFFCLLILLILKLTVLLLAFRPQYEIDGDTLSAEKVRKARSLWVHLGIYDITQNVFTWIDKFLVSLLLPAGLSAMYYNGTVNIPFLPMLLNAAGTGILLQLSANEDVGDSTHTKQTLLNSGRMLSCIVFPIFAYLFFFRQEVILFLFSGRYADAVPVFAMTLLVLPLRAYSFTTVLQRHHLGREINTGSLGDMALACLLMYPMYKLLGLPGLALTFVITTYLQAGYYLWAAGRVLNISPFSLIPIANWSTKLGIFSGLFFGLHYWITETSVSYGNGLMAGGLLMVVCMVVSVLIDVKNKGIQKV